MMDVVLPGMNGFQATRALSRDADTSTIPVLIVSTKGMDTDKAWGMRQGARDYIVKPPREDELIARINALLGA
jgi:twitching motility two-component system response regulator PilH